MPELPDVTIYMEAIAARVVGHALSAYSIRSPFILRTVDPSLDELVGRVAVGVERLGKRVVGWTLLPRRGKFGVVGIQELMMRHHLSRRTFLAAGAAALVALLVPCRTASAARLRARVPGPHPTPRAGITGVNVLTREQLAGKPQLVGLFDSVRAIPEVIDGIRCNCGCAHSDGFYSLLSCYEGKDAMAKECAICQGQGRLAVRLHKAGKSLDEIRAAVDAKFA